MMSNADKYMVPQNSAILVIDMQNDFCHKQGEFGKSGQSLSAIHDMAERLGNFVDSAREHGVVIIHVRSYLDEKFLTPPAIARNKQLGRDKGICLEGTWGAEFCGILPTKADEVVTKHTYSAFIGTDLRETLLEKEIHSLFVTGVLTNVCCESTLRHGFMLGFYTFLVEDCCASVEEAAHLAAVQNVQKYFGWVVKSNDILSYWKRLNS
jgi:ureidoacrylate peracid hydrolase